MKKLLSLSILIISIYFTSCNEKSDDFINTNEVIPWCILEFDSLDRTPVERITMLKEMGFSKYGYNWRDRHLIEMNNEFELAKKNNIEITSIFLWLNSERDSIGRLSNSNQQMLSNLSKVEYKPTIWLSFSNNFFENLNQEESINLAVDMIRFIKPKTDKLGCKLALYNHHGWFGNPYNQIEILEKLNDTSITMVYNFHHAHDYVDEFPKIVKMIKPHLSYVNLNGMKKNGNKILTIGEGDYEFEMIQDLIDEGFKGPWGILGHIKTEDVKKVLERNVEGLNFINSKLYDE